MSNKDTELEEEKITSFLTDALKKVETEADPDELTKLRRLFKKCVPLGRRSYVAGYLTKLLLEESSKPRRSRGERSERKAQDKAFDKSVEQRSEKKSVEKKEKRERIQIDESLASTIFIGIGRNRRVYPRDLVGLLASAGGIERERIGTIKVLANYSFVQLFSEDAEKVIAALNGYEYRGRKLSVSYSKQSDDESSSDTSAETDTSVSETSEPVSPASESQEQA